MVLDFGRNVTGYYIDEVKKKTLNINDINRGDYFDSNLYPILLGWLPLQEYYQQSISIYDYNPNARSGILKAIVKQVKSSTYTSEKSGIRKVWKVEVTDEIRNNENSSTIYYLDKEDRIVWKQEIMARG